MPAWRRTVSPNQLPQPPPHYLTHVKIVRYVDPEQKLGYGRITSLILTAPFDRAW